MKHFEIYLKDIERHIEGVIKADDDEFIAQEVDEYVVTKEVEKHLNSFFSEYNKKSYNDSVWISGFFGSGKSHLLKMLSFVLENKEIDGQKCGEIFAAKIKDDFELNANIKKALAIPTKTILFNIAQKADGIGNISSVDPILAVFMKVFNEFQGYYDQSPAIAAIERLMDDDEIYEDFKKLYQEINGKDWLADRKNILLNQNRFAITYAKLKEISDADAKNYFDDTRNNYKLDIDSYVKLVKAYLKKQPANLRLIFCVDEVGQYIAEDVRLMLSIQTLAETLASTCKNQAFLFVTSQNDLNATIGDLNSRQSHDFSKITGRFTIKIPLTSANADEVIQKRLLAKKKEGITVLSKIYEKEKNNLRTLFEFTDSSKQYSHYKSDEQFCLTYPFIPYQFDLFQSTIKSLSEHNAFMGRHQSVGERSMLGVFQQVAKFNSKNEVGTIVTYSQMYDGIRDILQSNIQSDIIMADRVLNNDFAVEVLKALFLVKYVKGFNATINNLTILLLPSFDIELAKLRTKIQEALNLLENQTYIQRIGDNYEFLTNQEKDVENEIKSTEIDPKAPGELLGTLIFDDILGDSKVRLDTNNQWYEYGKKIDDVVIGREKDLYVNFITPLNPNSVTTGNVAMKSIGTSDLIIHLPDDPRLFDELRAIKQTEKYIQTTTSPSLDPTKMRILNEKGTQKNERRRTLITTLKENIGVAKMYMNGSELNGTTMKEPKNKVTVGVQILIKGIYTQLSMLAVNFTEDDKKKIIDNRDDVLFKDELSTVEQEVLNRIARNKANHERTTTKSLLEFFQARPYGWYQEAILCIIAKLYKRNKVSIKQDGNSLDDKTVLQVLSSNREYGNTIIELEEEISNSQVKKVKDFYQEYFNENILAVEPKDISRLLKQRLVKEYADINELFALRIRFKFLEVLGEPLSRIKLASEKEHPYFFTAVDNYSNDLLDDKENVVGLIKSFMTGQQKEIFENVLFYLESDNANFNYIEKEGIEKLQMVKESPAPYKGTMMKEAKETLEKIKKETLKKIEEERKKGIEIINELTEHLKAFPEFKKISKADQGDLLKPLIVVQEKIKAERFIGNIRVIISQMKDDEYPRIIERMISWANPAPPEAGDETPKPRITYVTKDSVKVDYKKPALETKEDVEEYVNALKAKYLKIINDNKRISL
jgi:hypothetical protein